MVTDTVETNRRKRSIKHSQARAINEPEAQLYRDLAHASGGQAIEVTKAQLPVAAAIIAQSASSSVVMSAQVNMVLCKICL